MSARDDSTPASDGSHRASPGSPDHAGPAEEVEYAQWTEEDVARGAQEAQWREAFEARDGERRSPVDRDEDEPIVLDITTTDPRGGSRGARDGDQRPRRGEPFEFVPGGAAGRAGRGDSYRPGLSDVFGAGTPLGEATGLRLSPRRRWLAGLLGVALGFIGAQSFYTGRIFRGVFQAGLVLSSWMLTLITLGFLLPLAQGMTVVVWVWGAIEGIRYWFSRSGPYSRDVLGGPLH